MLVAIISMIFRFFTKLSFNKFNDCKIPFDFDENDSYYRKR